MTRTGFLVIACSLALAAPASAIGGLGGGVTNVTGGVTNSGSGATGTVSIVTGTVGGVVGDATGGGSGGTTGGVTDATGGATGAVGGAVGGATGGGTTGGVTGAVGGATGAVGGVVNGATEVVTGGSDAGGVGGAVDGVGGAVGGAAGTVGGIVGGVLGGSTDGNGSGSGGSGGGSTLPTGTLNSLLDTLLGVPAPSTATAGGGPGSTTSYGAASQVGSDHKAPRLSFTILSKIGSIAKTGRIKVRVKANEPSVVGFSALIRPGRALKKAGRVSRELIRVKAVVLAFRRAGTLAVTLELKPAARRNLGKAKDARMALQIWASDVARNQAHRALKRTLKR